MKDPFPKARIQSLKTIKNTQHYFDDGVGRSVLLSLSSCWRGAFCRRSVRCFGTSRPRCATRPSTSSNRFSIAFTFVLKPTSMQAGHQEWTKTGSEPKAPVEPSKDAPSMLQATGGYVTSAMSWVAGSFIGKSANTSETTGTAAGTAATSEAAASEKQPKAVSSSTVNSVLPAITRTELSMEELEQLGEPSKPESTLQRMDSLEDDVWGEEGKEDSKKKSEDGWENEGLKAMGGWDDTGLNFSDEENKELEKESQNLEMIRQMAERMKSKSESPKPKKSEEAWEDDFGGTKKTRTRRATAAKTAKPAAKPTKISDDDLMAMLNDDKPLAAKNAAAKKASDGWDDWDDEPAKKPAAKKASDGWDDDWNDEPVSASASKKASDGWDDWDDQPVSTSKSASAFASASASASASAPFASKPAVKKASDGWDDWDDQPAAISTSASKKASDGWDDWDTKPIQPAQPARSAARAPKVSKATSGWDDWDDEPTMKPKTTATATKKTTTSSGWDDDWDAQPASSSKKTTSSGWDDDW